MKKGTALLLTAVACLAVGPAGAADSHDPHAGSVMNYHRIDDRLVTGGHFVGDGMSEIKAEGVTVVLDLRDRPPKGQQQTLAEQGIEWINVPVEWDDPEPGDFELFVRVMQAHQADSVLVQCAANYRASAMTYLYRVVIEGVDERKAAADLNAVWTPSEESELWARYIEQVKSSYSKE